jgi:alcohol dehydrogenase class IV
MPGEYRYANPPVIRWGQGSIEGVSDDLEQLGVASIALVSTRSVTAEGGAGAAVLAALGPRSPVVTVLIRQHAPVADIETGVMEIAASGADAIVSVGGGSPVDAGKVIAIRVGEARGKAPLRHLAVPTTLSGAELSASAGMTDAAGNKVGLRDPRGLPDRVVYDGDLALATPTSLWLSTGIRAVDHGVEGFLADGEHPLNDVLAAEGLRRLFRSLPMTGERPAEGSIRTQNQLGAWLSFTLPGPTAGGLSHIMGKQIGARHGIPHGVTSCLLLPHVMRYQARLQPERTSELARAIGVGDDGLAAADAVGDLIRRLGLPQHIREFGIGEDELRAAAEALAGAHPSEELFKISREAL